MDFIKKTENELTIKFKNNHHLFLNSPSLLKSNWPVYEIWINDLFVGHWEFIPNHLIGINFTNDHRYWTFIYNLLFIFNNHLLPTAVLEKSDKDFIGHSLLNFKTKYHLKYIET